MFYHYSILKLHTMKINLHFPFIIILSFIFSLSFGQTLHVGPGQQYTNLQQAAAIAQPGDAIVIHTGIYTQREDISNLNGEPDNPIIIYAEVEGQVIFRGQSEAWHLSSCTNLFIYGFVFEDQTSNGVNIDDSGNYDNSTYNITIKNCIFRDMNASGNNDLLKLSGLNDFTVENCTFINGADGGSGIDMVGCHQGTFAKNRFKNMGSNCIQVKGGSQYITIKQNTFIDGGRRSLNLGGNTGLEYFRPGDAPFEAADIDVYSNIFIRSWAPIAYVGSTRVNVYNNTFFKPENWVFRILQETVDTARFIACGDNKFSNNIIYFGNNLDRIVNIGPNTRPESFIFANNLWYNFENPDFDNYNLPATETNSIKGKDPLFEDISNLNFDLSENSPAIGKGSSELAPELDFKDRYFNDANSIGAFEYNAVYKDFTGDIGTIWHYDFSYPGDYQTVEIKEKTIIDNIEYSLMDNNVFSYDFSGNRMEFYVFTSNNKTIYRDKYDNSYKLIDYNLKAKDTLESNILFSDKLSKSIIDSVKFQYLAGKVRKTLTVTPLNNNTIPFGNPSIFIEGIHPVNSFMLGDDHLPSYYFDKLRCYTYYNEKGIEFTEHFVDYPCDTIIVATNDFEFYGIETFPNPADNYLNIQFDNSFTGEIELYSITGKKLISRHVINTSKEIIRTDNIKPGAYMLFISNRTINTRKKITILK